MNYRPCVSHQLEPAEPGWEVENGTVFCDGMSLERLRTDLRRQYSSGASPVHLYSLATLRHNVRQYLDALIPVVRIIYSSVVENNGQLTDNSDDAATI